ncbi:hypothetical protein D7I43_04555 [Micromonospora globbae]|uniref:Uncharacterized protein n=1 Tax=Micromonospora globbae TaxID=1894969 RepID=A0A420F5V2_9ACTN|nr:hypothetical protein D7I43_04555 [Micromonospora globbae]
MGLGAWGLGLGAWGLGLGAWGLGLGAWAAARRGAWGGAWGGAPCWHGSGAAVPGSRLLTAGGPDPSGSGPPGVRVRVSGPASGGTRCAAAACSSGSRPWAAAAGR